MRVILKPAGIVILLVTLIALAVIAITGRGRSGAPSVATGGDTAPPVSAKSGGESGSAPRPTGGMELKVSDDAYVAAADYAQQTRADTQDIVIKTPITLDERHHRVGYFKIPLSSLPGTSVKSAKLAFFVNDLAKGRATPLKPGQPMRLSLIGLADNSWSPSSLTWNTQPKMTGATKIGVVPITENGWNTVDVTDYINRRLAADHMATFRFSDDQKLDTAVRIRGTRATSNQPYLLVTQ